MHKYYNKNNSKNKSNMKGYFFYPINCIKNETKNENHNQDQDKYKSISIIASINNQIQNEWNAFNIINKIIDYEKYFYIFDSIEKITYNELKDDDFFLEGSNIINNSTNLVLIKYSDKPLYSLKETIINTCNLLQRYQLIINSYKYLLDSLNLLIENKIIHNNIQDSVIYLHNINNIKPIFIKFDHAIHINNQLDLLLLNDYNPSNYHLPLEFHMLSFLQSNKLNSLSNHNIQTIVDDIYNNENNIYIKEFKEEGLLFLNTCINKSIQNIKKDILNYYPTWDNYRLSIYYLSILLESNQNQSPIDQTSLINLLRMNIHPNPNKRYSISSTKIYLTDLLKEINY